MAEASPTKRRRTWRQRVLQHQMVMSGGGATYEAEALTLFAAMTTPPSAARKSVINTLIRGLKNASLWTKLNKLYVCAAHDDQAGRVEWKNPGTHTLVKNGSLTFTTDVGFNSDGSTGYLDVGTGYESFGTFAKDSNALGVWFSGSGSAVIGWGRATTGGRYLMLLNNTGGVLTWRDSMSITTQVTAHATVAGHTTMTRRGATEIELYLDAVTIQNDATSSLEIGTGNAWLLASTTVFAPNTAKLEMAYSATALSDGEVSALHALLVAYRVSL